MTSLVPRLSPPFGVRAWERGYRMTGSAVGNSVYSMTGSAVGAATKMMGSAVGSQWDDTTSSVMTGWGYIFPHNCFGQDVQRAWSHKHRDFRTSHYPFSLMKVRTP